MVPDALVEFPAITEEYIRERFWTYGLDQGGLFARNVVLGKNGRILHYSSPNERRWRLENGQVLLLAQDGNPSARLTPMRSTSTGKIRLVGEHIIGGPSGLILALQETDLDYPVYFHWTKAMQDYITSVPIYLTTPFRTHGVYEEGQLIKMERPAHVEPHASLPFGSFLDVGAYSYCHGSFPSGTASIGRYCSIAANAQPIGPAHPMERISTSLFTYDPHFIQLAAAFGVDDYVVQPYDQSSPPVLIGHDVWIGEGVMIKGGVSIGTGSVLGARTMVTKDVPPYSVVVGTPGKVIRQRFASPIIDGLLQSEWWAYNFCDLPQSTTDPERFLRDFKIRVEEGTARRWCPGRVDIAVEMLRADGNVSAP